MKEKTIKPKKWLHWLLGKKIGITNLVLFVLFAVLTTTILVVYHSKQFLQFAWWQQALYVLVAVFTFFSMVINITLELSKLYENNNKYKLLYILFSVQPWLLYLVNGGVWWHFGVVWLYTVVSSLFIMVMRARTTQKAVGFGVLAFSMVAFAFCFQTMTTLFSLVLLAYIVNVAFCVAVSQYIDPKF